MIIIVTTPSVNAWRTASASKLSRTRPSGRAPRAYQVMSAAAMMIQAKAARTKKNENCDAAATRFARGRNTPESHVMATNAAAMTIRAMSSSRAVATDRVSYAAHSAAAV